MSTQVEFELEFCFGTLEAYEDIDDYTLSDTRNVTFSQYAGISFSRCSSLYRAVQDQNLETISFLIKRGVNINDGSCGGNSPLNLAVKLDNIDIVRYLLDHGADFTIPSTKIRKYKDPLYWAIENRNIDMVRLLIDHGAVLTDKHKTQNIFGSLINIF